MKKTALYFVAVAVLLAVQGGGVRASDSRTLTGEFIWESGDSDGALEAVFTATGEQAWDVAFHFEFRDKPHTYSGTATGSLSEGKLEGEVKNEDKKRTFTFEGRFEDGTFRGTHAEIRRGGSRRDTGTMTLNG